MPEKNDWVMDRALVRERLKEQKCPYCGAEREGLDYGTVEIDGKEAHQVVDCMNCERHFTEVYAFKRVILTDYPGDDFRIDFDD
jgi:transcription elongation factor Elf1